MGTHDAIVASGEAGMPSGDGVTAMSLEEVKACDVAEMAREKLKSRQLQRSLTRGGPDHVEVIFAKILPSIVELSVDQHANYLVQKLIEVVDGPKFKQIFDSFKSQLVTLAKDSHGTRAVQKIVEQANTRKLVPELLEALPMDCFEELARHITGFHVIVKLVEHLPQEHLVPLLEKIVGTPEKVVALSKDQWGCCVLKKCIDYSEGAMRSRITGSIASNAQTLVQDPFANYVVQHLVINELADQNTCTGTIIHALSGHVLSLSLLKFSSNVLERIIGNSTDRQRSKIINEILNPPDGQKPSEAVRKLLFHKFGNYVIQQALEVAKEPQFSLLIEHVKQDIQDFYIEATKQRAQGGIQYGDGSSGPGGSMPAEHCQRLAVKLVKKYPALTEGMDLGSMMGYMDSSWMYDYDPYGYNMGYYPGVDPYGFPMGNPYMQYPPMPDFIYPSAPPRMRMGKGSAKPKKSAGPKGAGKGGVARDDEPMKVGRIVGFWPNYEYVEDEASGSHMRKHKNKA